MSLIQHGVTEFATVNVKDFENMGFRRVWSPVEEPEEADAEDGSRRP